ncbi:MAG TPA: rhodanese-like domain-containing protein [Anaerolineales bacterium]|nr:rhodanese-like domain-containing protein [Anaerolineales bacterium]
MKTNLIKQNRAILLVVVFALLAFWTVSCGGAVGVQETVLPPEVTVQDGHAFYDEGGYILDVRTQEEWVEGHVPGATLIPLDQLANRLDEVPADQPVYVICRSGNRSAVARDLLQDNGFEQVTSIGGGFNQWSANGFPVETGP